MTQPKPLHLGQDLKDLERHYCFPKSIGRKKVMLLCTTANKLKQQADITYLDKDEESAYVQYMKYLNLISTIRNHADYRDNRKVIMSALGSNTEVQTIYEKLDRLKGSLESRYAGASAKKERERNKQRSQQDNITPIISHYKNSVDAKELLEMIINSKLSMLIMDCRPENDFESSGIKYDHVVNIPDHLLVAGMTAGKIQDKISPPSKHLWTSRRVKEQIVLMDYDTEGVPRKDTPLWVLNDILMNWDPDVVYQQPLLRVEGGYKTFQLHYPMYCTNPNYTPISTVHHEDTLLDEIEYPNLSDIRMKEDSFGSQPGRPVIDRNSKAAALRRYGTEAKPMVEILDEQEKMMDKSIQNELEMLTAENQLKQIHEDQEKSVNDESKQELLEERFNELKYRLMEMEDKQKEYMLEHNRLTEIVQVYEAQEHDLKERGEKISAREAAMLEHEAQRRIEQKREQQQRVEAERVRLHKQRLDQERAEKLRYAYDQKRRLNKENREELVEPARPSSAVTAAAKLPQFDRASKPNAGALSDHNHNVQQRELPRDFAPVYGNVGRGLTGLKNLGNTCYMNSILQCLSNTTFLREHFVEGQFQQYLNRSNKTQGRIVEEVAAVVKALWAGQYKCIASKNLRYVVGQYERQFGGIEQQDSHEFLTILMDWLHSDLQTITMETDTFAENSPASEKAWIEYLKGKESYISRLYYGQIKSTVKCKRCLKESATYESFSNLSLELPPDANRCYLYNCLEMYFNGETIHGWNCPQCKSNQEAIKKLSISRLPSILVVHFKRFYADPDAIATVYKKKQNFVEFPLCKLDMTSHIAPSELGRNKSLRNRRYNLFGVSNHFGSMESGHYTAFCRNSEHQKWYKFDDHTVSSLSASDVCSSAGYILFYSSLPEHGQTDVQMR